MGVSLEMVQHVPMVMSAQRCLTTVTKMLAASILPVPLSANVTLASQATVRNVTMLMSAIWVSTTAINSQNARTNTVLSPADAVHDSLVSPTSMVTDKNVLTLTSALLVLTTVMPMPPAPTQWVASTAHAMLVMKVMVPIALMLTNVLLALTTAVPTQTVPIPTVDLPAHVPLVSSRKTVNVSISTSASRTKTTVATMLHALILRVLSSALATTGSLETVLPAMISTSALTTLVVKMLLATIPKVVSNVSVTLVL